MTFEEYWQQYTAMRARDSRYDPDIIWGREKAAAEAAYEAGAGEAQRKLDEAVRLLERVLPDIDPMRRTAEEARAFLARHQEAQG